MTENKKSHFKIKNITDLKDLDCLGKLLPESDLTIQTSDRLIQFEHVEIDEERERVKIKPGVWSFVNTSMGIGLSSFKLRERDLLKTIDNTKVIISEADKFFKPEKIALIKELRKGEARRSILLHSQPGVGKSAAITEVCKHYVNNDPNTAVIIWDTSSIRSSAVNSFFLNQAEFLDTITKVIFVIEDIGGGSVDQYEGGTRGADSALLNLLDGVGRPFGNTPVFLIATTNNPETATETLIDRPGRFDKVIELPAPSLDECKQLLAFYLKKELSKEDEKAAEVAQKNNFSIAHIQECVIRSLIDDISTHEAAKQLEDHKKKFKNAFKKIKKGIGFMED